MKIATLQNELFAAICHNEADTVRKLLEAGAEVNAVFDNGLTPLMVAARAGAHDAIETLLHYGADAGATDAHGRTPLLFLCNWGECNHYNRHERHTETARILLECGADGYACDDKGDSAFWHCCRYGLSNVLRLIHATRPIPLEARHRCGDTPLLMASRPSKRQPCGGVKVVDLLIQAGADITATGADGKNARQIHPLGNYHFLWKNTLAPQPISIPVNEPPRQKKQRVFNDTTPPTVTDEHGYTALHRAARSGDETSTLILLNKGAEINAVATNGLTPLMLAARGGWWRVGLLLLAHGADRYCVDECGRNAIDYAERAGNWKLLDAMQI